MSIRWITDVLGTAPYGQFAPPENAHIVDVRDMVDQAGNTADLAMAKVNDGAAALGRGQSVVVCCDYGISRSNVIAAGVLARHEGLAFDNALSQVIEATGEQRMQIGVVRSVRAGLEGDANPVQKASLLITGASGLIGTALQQRLGNREDVIAPDRSQIDLVEGSVGLDLAVQQSRPDSILHLANPRIFTVSRAMGDTLVMLKNVLEVCVAHDLRLIYPSGWEVFSGYRSNGLVATKHLPPNPGGTYGQTKLLAEALIDHYQQHCGLRVTLLRASPVYGAGDKPKFIHHFIAKALRADPIHTHRYQNGDPGLDLLHVDDFTDLLARICSSPIDGVINIGSGTLTTTAQIARNIVKILDSKSEISYRSIEAWTPNIQMDVTETCHHYDWHARVTLHDGLKQLIELHRSSMETGDNG